MIIGCLAALGAMAQNMPDERDQGSGARADSTASDLADMDSIESVIKVWTLSNQYSTVIPAHVDSATIGFNNYNPIFRRSISNNYLGYSGASYESNIFFDRTRESNFYFLQNFDAYRLTPEQVRYYNTTTPYASLMYEQGAQGSDSKKEQEFKAFFTHNIDSITNFGFRFNAIKAPGQYLLQQSNHNFLNVFASRNGKRLNSYFNFINSTDNIIENGGIIDSTVNRFRNMTFLGRYPISVREDPAALFVNLANQIENENKSFSIFTSHEYLMGQIPFLEKEIIPDSLLNDTIAAIVPQKAFIPRYSIQYSAEFESHQRRVLESTVDQAFFDTTYINSTSHIDSAFYNRFSHILQVKMLENEQRKFTFGKRAFIENEIVSAKHPLPDGQRKYTYSNVYVGGEIYRSNSSLLNWNATARFAILGRNLGDAIIKGSATMPLIFGKDTTLITAQGWYQDRTADIFQEHWFGNHFKWENSFRKEHEVAIKGAYHYPRFKASAGVNYALLSNFLYNNELAIPDQYNGEFSLLSAWLNKDFHLGRFGWSNKMIWQGLSNDAVLHLPTWSFYSSIYYSHYLFKVMKLQFGAEVYYHTKFKSDSYQPSTTQFYLQNDVVTGGYPLINLFVNAKLARTTAFAELYHANSVIQMGEFFSSPAYPLDQMAFRFGFFWTFYD